MPAMQQRLDFPAAIAVLAAVLALATARAWLCDDAFITFRVVEQLLLGNGPVYNAGERVQVFTHPLWFLLLSAWRTIGLPLHPGAIALSLLVFASGLAALAWAFRDRALTLAAVLVALLLSRAAMDYATSGLETPMSFALAMGAVAGLRAGRRALAISALALMPLSRPDLAVWVLPFAFVVPATGWRGRFGVLLMVAAPALAWAMFSTIYYGSPVPNTALAKLGGETWERIGQGLSYVTASLVTDPGTLALVALGLALGAARGGGDPIVRAGLGAMLLSLAYVLWAGGDFMLGRFLLPAVWAAIVTILAAVPAPREHRADRRWLGALGGLLVASHVIYGDSTLHARIGSVPGPGHAGPNFDGAVDERRFYLPWLGLFPTRDAREMDFVVQPGTPTDPEIVWTLGLRGFHAPPAVALVDWFALAEPMLARIRPFPGGRPGHAARPLPEQFWRWRDPAHAFGDARLDALARDLRLAHRSRELFTVERFGAIARLLRERRVPVEAIDVRGAGERVEIVIHAARIDARVPRQGKPVVWVSRDCEPERPRLRGGYLIPVDGRGVARLHCPAAGFERIPLAVSAGTFDPPDAAEPRFAPQGVQVVRGPWGSWIAQVPRWATSGRE